MTTFLCNKCQYYWANVYECPTCSAKETTVPVPYTCPFCHVTETEGKDVHLKRCQGGSGTLGHASFSPQVYDYPQFADIIKRLEVVERKLGDLLALPIGDIIKMCEKQPDKPVVDWSLYPKWLTCLYRNTYGTWFLSDKVPRLHDGIWDNYGEQQYVVPDEYAPKWNGRWQDSLCERPKS